MPGRNKYLFARLLFTNRVCLRYEMSQEDCTVFNDQLFSAYDINGINSVLSRYGLPVTAVLIGGALDYERNYNISFDVVGSTVDLQIRKANVGTWGKSVNVNVGDDIQLQWLPQNAVSCKLIYDGKEEIVSAKNHKLNHTQIDSIKKDTTYTIICEP